MPYHVQDKNNLRASKPIRFFFSCFWYLYRSIIVKLANFFIHTIDCYWSSEIWNYGTLEPFKSQPNESSNQRHIHQSCSLLLHSICWRQNWANKSIFLRPDNIKMCCAAYTQAWFFRTGRVVDKMERLRERDRATTPMAKALTVSSTSKSSAANADQFLIVSLAEDWSLPWVIK